MSESPQEPRPAEKIDPAPSDGSIRAGEPPFHHDSLPPARADAPPSKKWFGIVYALVGAAIGFVVVSLCARAVIPHNTVLDYSLIDVLCCGCGGAVAGAFAGLITWGVRR